MNNEKSAIPEQYGAEFIQHFSNIYKQEKQSAKKLKTWTKLPLKFNEYYKILTIAIGETTAKEWFKENLNLE